MTVRSFSASKRCLGGASVRLELAGDVHGVTAELLTPMILDAIVADRANELHVDLDAVTYLDSAGVLALVRGYVAAVECGSVYRVVNAQGQVQRVLEATGVMEVLADSEDLGAFDQQQKSRFGLRLLLVRFPSYDRAEILRRLHNFEAGRMIEPGPIDRSSMTH